MSEDDLQILESRFLNAAASAFASAGKRALASGLKVLQSEDGVIYEVFPDGRRVEVKKIEPPTQVVAGSVFEIR